MTAVVKPTSFKLWHKFLFLSVIALVLAAIPTYFYVHEAAKGLDAYQREQQGLPAIVTGLRVIQLTQQHRGLSALALGGGVAAQSKRDAKQSEADAAYAALGAIVTSIHDAAINEVWSGTKHDWDVLRTGVSDKHLSVAESYADHTALVLKLLKLNDLLGDFYGLSLDPDKDTYQLIQAMFYQLPYLSEELGKTRAKGAGLLIKKDVSSQDRLALSSLVTSVSDRMAQALSAFNKAAANNSDLQDKLGQSMKEVSRAASRMAALTMAQIILPETHTFSPEEYVKTATEAIDLQFALNAAASKELDSILTEKIAAFHQMRWIMLGAMLGMVAIAGFIAMLISRSVTRPLEQAIRIAKSVASGNLVNDFDVGKMDEVGQVLRALREMNNGLRTIVGDVRQGIVNISAATRDIAMGNADVSFRLESQASNLQETASSLEELTSTVQQNADNARQANELVIGAASAAANGSEVVSNVVHTMNKINDSSRKIVDIIAVIDGIAFQTNILALNAAVEAARAGEQGRGFAVVASEVRNLAQRSANAAKEIKALINDSVQQVGLGNDLAAHAGVAMEGISSSVERITAIMSEIAVASLEQGMGIEQINSAVTQMDDMTQQNAALVEETAAASADLKEQAEALVESMSVFRLTRA